MRAQSVPTQERFSPERNPPFRTFLEDRDDGTATKRLREGFRQYYSAMFERNADAKAESIFLANGLIGLTEQIRLQPTIEQALSHNHSL